MIVRIALSQGYMKRGNFCQAMALERTRRSQKDGVSMLRWVLLGLLPLVCLADSFLLPRQFPHDAYIWQRQWNSAVVVAMQQSSDLIRVWRVLAATSDSRGHIQPVAVDWSALARSGRAVVPVVRIEGQLMQWETDIPSDEVRNVLAHWRAYQLPIAGIEIDHDCGTARLPAYAEFLMRLRARLDKDIALSITALPTWLSSSHLAAVLKPVDEVVLQVHAVQNPRAGLFHAQQARRWIEDWSQHHMTPFRVALPTYGSRVSWRTDGSLHVVESETSLLAGGYGATELLASPTEVQAFLAELERRPVPRLRGVVWFRLPTAEDRRAWSLATWRAVLSRQSLHALVEVEIDESNTPGMHNLVLVNRGEVDTELPGQVILPYACTLADGINGYVLKHRDGGLFLQRVQEGLLRSHRQQLIGWMRCAAQEGDIHVRP